MSGTKQYFYMRMKEDFFQSQELIAVEAMENGYLYSNILLKLYLLSLRNEGRIMAGTIPYSPAMLARAVGHDEATVRTALALFKDVGLITILDSGAIYMLDIQSYIGQASTEADRKREYRSRIKAEAESLGKSG